MVVNEIQSLVYKLSDLIVIPFEVSNIYSINKIDSITTKYDGKFGTAAIWQPTVNNFQQFADTNRHVETIAKGSKDDVQLERIKVNSRQAISHHQNGLILQQATIIVVNDTVT